MSEVANPDLRNEREFLIRSLDDLETEHAAGDLSDQHLNDMRADYQAKLADVQRRIEGDGQQHLRDAETAVRMGRSKRRTKVFLLAATVFAVGTGFLIAGSLGERKAGQTITGNSQNDVAANPQQAKINELMQRAQELSGTDPLGSIEAYDAVVKLNPEIVSAWAYGGWQLRIYSRDVAAGPEKDTMLNAAKRRIDEAIKRDPEYPDAYAFRAVLAARDMDDETTARAALQKLETLPRNPQIDQLTGPLRSDLGLPAVGK
jgi:tetratricopeptide (TPR) repeat protein